MAFMPGAQVAVSGFRRERELFFHIGWSTFLMVVVAGPWLGPGYLFGADWPGPRRFYLPTELSSTAPLQAALFAVTQSLPAEGVGKGLWFAILWFAAATSYAAVPSCKFIPRAVASTLYVLNPFVYGRLHYGQVFLLGAYALLPWVAGRFRVLAKDANFRAAIGAGLGLLLIGTFSLHLFLIATVFGIVVLIAKLAVASNRLRMLGDAWKPWAIAALFAGVCSAYWWIPIFVGAGYEGSVIAATSSGDLRAYAPVPDPSLGLLPNLLGLYGFWAENSSRFASMKIFVPGWPIALVLLIAICAVGAIAAAKRRTDGLNPWGVALVAAGAIAVVLEMGSSSPFTAWLVDWLDTHLVVYRGMRDSAKWAALLALVYSQLFGLGAADIIERVRNWRLPLAQVEWLSALATSVLIALPMYYGNGLLFGMHGEINPSHYPAGWYAADQLLLSDPNPGKALFLPWHEYMAMSFVQNQNPVIASPARTFFSISIVASTDPEISGVKPSGPDQTAVSELVRATSSTYWAQVLADRGIKYLLLVKEVDWRSYDFLNSQSDIIKVADFGSIVVYRNTLVQ